MKLVYIEWADALANSSPVWMTLDEIEEWEKASDCFVSEVGYIVKEDEHIIVLASRKQTISGQYEPQFGQLQKIPRTWVRKRKTIKI